MSVAGHHWRVSDWTSLSGISDGCGWFCLGEEGLLKGWTAAFTILLLSWLLFSRVLAQSHSWLFISIYSYTNLYFFSLHKQLFWYICYTLFPPVCINLCVYVYTICITMYLCMYLYNCAGWVLLGIQVQYSPPLSVVLLCSFSYPHSTMVWKH